MSKIKVVLFGTLSSLVVLSGWVCVESSMSSLLQPRSHFNPDLGKRQKEMFSGREFPVLVLKSVLKLLLLCCLPPSSRHFHSFIHQ